MVANTRKTIDTGFWRNPQSGEVYARINGRYFNEEARPVELSQWERARLDVAPDECILRSFRRAMARLRSLST